MYEKILRTGDEEKALQIARQKYEQCVREGKTIPSQMCPCTTVYQREVTLYGYEVYRFGGYEFCDEHSAKACKVELAQTEAEIGAMSNGSEVLSIYAENDIETYRDVLYYDRKNY